MVEYESAGDGVQRSKACVTLMKVGSLYERKARPGTSGVGAGRIAGLVLVCRKWYSSDVDVGSLQMQMRKVASFRSSKSDPLREAWCVVRGELLLF